MHTLYRDAPDGPWPKCISHLDLQLEVAKGLIDVYTNRERKTETDLSRIILNKSCLPYDNLNHFSPKRLQDSVLGPEESITGFGL